MKIIISHSSMVPIYEQLVGRIKSAVVSGELSAGDALPSVRSLAAELEISALTVKKAYDRLEDEGILVTVHGKGSFISDRNSGLIEEERRREAENSLADAVERAASSGYSRADILQFVEMLLEEEI